MFIVQTEMIVVSCSEVHEGGVFDQHVLANEENVNIDVRTEATTVPANTYVIVRHIASRLVKVRFRIRRQLST